MSNGIAGTDGYDSLKALVPVVKALAKTTKRTKKLEILRAAWDNRENFGLFVLFHTAYDLTRTFGVKKVPKSIPYSPGFFNDLQPKTFEDFIELINDLVNRRLTGNDMIGELQTWARICDPEVWDILYAPCLRRDMRCGINESTWNDFLDSLDDPRALKFKIKASLDTRFLGVQLAKDGKDTGDKYKKGRMIADAKFDGSRLLTIVDVHRNSATQYTRGGIVNHNFPHIRQYMLKMIPELNGNSWCFDGEIMDPTDFQNLMTKMNRKYEVDTESCYYILFDAFPYDEYVKGIVELPYELRINMLQDHFEEKLLEVSEGKIQVNPYEVLDFDTPEGHAKFQELNDKYLRSKKEGIMLKDPKGFYTAGKRTDAWIKFKPKIQVTLKIVGYFPGKSGTKNEATFGSLILEGHDWDPADQRVKFIQVKADGFDEDVRAWIWENKDACLGRLCEIEADKVQQEKSQIGTDNWSLRFPKWKSWRDTMENPGVKV